MPARLYNALIEHSVGHFHESSDVRANHEIAWVAILLAVSQAFLWMVNMMWRQTNQLLRAATANASSFGLISSPKSPRHQHCCFPGTEKNFFCPGKIYARRHGRHVGGFGKPDRQPFSISFLASSPVTSFCVAQGNAQSHLILQGRWPAHILSRGIFGVLANAPAPHVLDTLDKGQFFFRDPVFVVNEAARIGYSDGLRTALDQLFHGKLGQRCRRRRRYKIFPSIVSLRVFKHFLSEIDRAVTGRFRAHQRAAQLRALPVNTPVNSFARRLYWPKRYPISRLPTPIVASRHIGVRTNMAE